jgi:hypothetical protein
MLIKTANDCGINVSDRYISSLRDSQRKNLILAVENGLLRTFSKIFPYKVPEKFDDGEIMTTFKNFNILLQITNIIFNLIYPSLKDNSDSKAIIRIVFGILEYIRLLPGVSDMKWLN